MAGTRDTENLVAPMIIGNALGNTTLEENGIQKLNGEALQWDDLQVVLTGAELHPTQSPTWINYRGSRALQFDGTAAQTIYFIAQLPHKYSEGTNLDFHLHAVHLTAATGDVQWDFTHSWANIGDEFPTETLVQKTFPVHDSPNIHGYGDVANIDGIGKKISSIVLCSLTRRGDIDSSSDNSVLIGADFHHLIDAFGSAQELIK